MVDKPKTISYSAGNESHFGLKRIFTNQEEITQKNIVDIVNSALETYKSNKTTIEDLKQIFCGNQAILSRVNENTSTNEKININILPAIVNTVAGLQLGEKVDYVYNGGQSDEDKESKEKQQDITYLNKAMRFAGDILCDKETLVELLVSGVAYQYGSANPKLDKDILLTTLSGLDCFAIRSTSIGYPIILTCIYNKFDEIETVTAFNDTQKFVLTKDKGKSEWKVDTSNHLLAENPIQEIKANEYMLSLVSQLEAVQNAFNLAVSDSVNSTIQQINALLAVMGAEITKDDAKKAKETGILNATAADGRQITANFISKPLDQNISVLRQFLWDIAIFIAGLPKEGVGGSGNNGAVMFASGIFTANQNAYFNELEFHKPKQALIANVIEVLKQEGKIKSDLSSFDIEIRFDRNKLTNIVENANALATLVSTGAPIKDALKVTGIFNDIDRVAQEMEARIKEKVSNELIKQTEQKQQDDNGADKNNNDGDGETPNETIEKNRVS